MAAPQLEEGYTRIANELLEALARAELSGIRHRIMLAIIRETYGFRRKFVQIGYQALATKYGFNRPILIREMAWLVDRKFLTKHEGATNTWGIQKDHTVWKGTSHQGVTSHQIETSDDTETSLRNGDQSPFDDQVLVTKQRLGTSHHLETTKKKERKKENDDVGAMPKIDNSVVGALIDLGCLKGQALGLAKRNPNLTVEVLNEWARWQEHTHADQPIALMISHLKEGRTSPPPYRVNGKVQNSRPPPADDEPLTMDEIKARAAKYRAALEESNGTPDETTVAEQTTGP